MSQVETYECSETMAEPIEACEEAVAIMEKMDLAGQKELLRPAEDGPPARCPYREMRRDEAFVYGVLCPQQTPIERYGLSPIPLRVLQIAAHANELGIYRKLEIWHAAEVAVPDPVLVGLIGGEYDWNVKARHILARWGDELESWPVLLKRAVEKKREQIRDVYATLARQLQAASVGDDLTSEELIAKGAAWKPELHL